MENFEKYSQVILGVIMVVKAITICTPTRSDNKILDVVLRILNLIVLNVLKDKNADDFPDMDWSFIDEDK